MIRELLIFHRQKLNLNGILGSRYRLEQGTIMAVCLLGFALLFCRGIVAVAAINTKKEIDVAGIGLYFTLVFAFFFLGFYWMGVIREKFVETHIANSKARDTSPNKIEAYDIFYQNFKQLVSDNGWDDKQLEAIHLLLGKEIEKRATSSRLLMNVITVFFLPAMLIVLNGMVSAFSKAPSVQWQLCGVILLLCIGVWILLKLLKQVTDEQLSDVRALEELQDFINRVHFMK